MRPAINAGHREKSALLHATRSASPFFASADPPDWLRARRISPILTNSLVTSRRLLDLPGRQFHSLQLRLGGHSFGLVADPAQS